jgi:MSHA biogenesis protein MshO
MPRSFDSHRRGATLRTSQQGFTLIEAIMVITLTGIIAGMVAAFMGGSIRSYFDATRRADISDTADTAMRRMGRDIQGALPNSVRVSGNYLEFVPIEDAGRYRTEVGINAADDPLDFTAPDSSFDVLGPPVTVANGDRVVIFNMGQAGASVYDSPASNAFATDSAGTVTKVGFASGVVFAFASPNNRFQIVRRAVSSVCDVANGRLMRFSNYAIQSAQPTSLASLPLSGAAAAVMASNVSACNLTYSSGVLERNGLVTLHLTITEQGESVDMRHQVSVANTP